MTAKKGKQQQRMTENAQNKETKKSNTKTKRVYIFIALQSSFFSFFKV
jgi:hypothetical protein